MKTQIILSIISILSVNVLFSQLDTVGLSEEVKGQLIYMSATDETSSTTYSYTDGSSQGGGSTRRVTLSYTVGHDNTVYQVDKKAEHLQGLIQNDKKAMNHYNNALKCLKKANIYNIAEIGFEITALGGVVWTIVRKNKNESAEYAVDRKPLALPIIVASVSAVGFYFCFFKSHSMLTKYKEYMVGSVAAYNQGVIEQSKGN